jgi:hypothetical protein
MTGLGVGQGAAIIAAGALAEATTPTAALAGFGLAGTLAALNLNTGSARHLAHNRTRPASNRETGQSGGGAALWGGAGPPVVTRR